MKKSKKVTLDLEILELESKFAPKITNVTDNGCGFGNYISSGAEC